MSLAMQTGSGKTHTMLGEIEDLEFKPSPQRGMTPRIFEFLFARIEAVILALFFASSCLRSYVVVNILFSFLFLVVGRGN